ncbi:MAG: type II secretion system F family protein [Deltaproteobacteria bacterium]|nr:type II secretion system F family protein [Deltaproteobacteria bacterium]
MPLYSYQASSLETGEKVTGELEAESVRSLRSMLRSKGLVLLESHESGHRDKEPARAGLNISLNFTLSAKKVSYYDLAVFTRQLATLIQAGFQLVPAISKLSQITKNATLRGVLVNVKERVEEGSSFSQALRSHSKVFPEFYINMISAGEKAGNIDIVLENLSGFLERQVELTKKVISSLFYPAIMIGLSIVVVVVLFTVVVPQIAEIFVKEGAKLPFITRTIIATSSFLSSYWFVLVILAAFIILRINRISKTDEGKAKIDKFVYNAPLFGEILRKLDLARFSLTLGSLLKGGVGMISALELSRKVLKNSEFEQNIVKAVEDVKRGKNFSGVLEASKVFPDLFVSMVSLGEQSGNLDSMLLRIADFYEKEATQGLQTLVNLIEPVMIILIGLLVLVVVFAVITPIVDMINILKK